MRPSLETLVRELLRREPVAALVAGRIGDLVGQRFEWVVGEELSLPARIHHLEVPTGATLAVEIDGVGSLVDGGIAFDPDQEAFLIIEISAIGESRDAFPLPSLPASARAAFTAGAEVVFSNGFRHSKDEPIRRALERDLGRLILPGDLGDHPLQITETGEPAQFIHLAGSGEVSLSGSLRWKALLVEAGTVSVDRLEMESALIRADAGASLSWRGSLEGNFDLVVFAAGEGRLQARLTRRRSAQRRHSFEADAGITVAGTEALAEAVLDPLFGPAHDLVRQLEKDLAAATDFRQALESEVDDRLERLLEHDRVIEGIERWLKMVAIDVDLRRRVRALLADAIGIAAAGTIDRLEEASEPAVEALRELLREYRLAVRRIETRLREAARVEVGLALTRSSASSRKASDLLTVRFDASRNDLLSFLLHGDWGSVIEAARNDDEVEVEGSLRREGSIAVEGSLEVRFLRARAGIGSMLRQSWSYEIGAFGDLTVATRGTLQVWSRSWRSLRTLRILADSRVTGAVAGAIDRESRRLTVEWAVEMRPTTAQLERWERRLAHAAILSDHSMMAGDLPLVGQAHRQRPFGELLLTVRFTPAPAALEHFSAASPESVRRAFARILAEEYIHSHPMKATDASGLPLFAWPEVLAITRSGAIDSWRSPLRIRGRGGRDAIVRREHLPLIAFAARLVLSFGELQSDLRALVRRATSLDDPQKLVDEMTRTERRMLRRIQGITAATPLRRADLGFAFFRTLFDLWTEEETRQARVVVLRRTDRRRFVY